SGEAWRPAGAGPARGWRTARSPTWWAVPATLRWTRSATTRPTLQEQRVMTFRKPTPTRMAPSDHALRTVPPEDPRQTVHLHRRPEALRPLRHPAAGPHGRGDRRRGHRRRPQHGRLVRPGEEGDEGLSRRAVAPSCDAGRTLRRALADVGRRRYAEPVRDGRRRCPGRMA